MDTSNNQEQKKIKFTNKKVYNHIFVAEWLQKNTERYNIHSLNYGYSNSNYQIKDKESKSEEVLVTNY